MGKVYTRYGALFAAGVPEWSMPHCARRVQGGRARLPLRGALRTRGHAPSGALAHDLDIGRFDDLSANRQDDALYVSGARGVRRIPYEQIYEVELAKPDRSDVLCKRVRYDKHRLLVYLQGELLEITRPPFFQNMKEVAATLREHVTAAY